MYRYISSIATLILLFLQTSGEISAAQMAMGFRVGEVTQNSAIVWTRITTNKERNWKGVRLVGSADKRIEKYTPLSVSVDELEGAVPGAAGSVRVTWKVANGPMKSSEWMAVNAKNDYSHQFPLTDLKPATKYNLRVKVRSSESDKVATTQTGSFTTAATAQQWQDVRFGVVTGQAYKDLDDPKGFHIYPAMGKLGLNFLIPTGDTVYYDSEKPRARTVALARHHWQRMYSLPRVVEFHRYVPGYWEKDDHDTLNDDGWPGQNPKWMLPLTWEDGLRLFREQNPLGEKTYRTIRWGKGLQIWMVEGRDFRSSNKMKDGPEKMIWGKEQLAWLKRTILESDADFRVLISPTPIVGPDRSSKRDNHSNPNFAYAGNHFRNWTKEQGLKNFFICCGDRHWQYMSVHGETGLREFSCGPASDEHAGGTPGHDMKIQPFHSVQGGFLTVTVTREKSIPTISFQHRNVHGKVAYEYRATSETSGE